MDRYCIDTSGIIAKPANDVCYVLCSPFERTMDMIKRGFLYSAIKRQRTAILWQDLRDCADEITPYDTGKLLKNFQRCVSRSSFDYSLLRQGWENDTWAVTHGKERAQGVREQLHELAKVVLKGGKWKEFEFAAYTGKKDLHIVILSHSKFLYYLTQMDLLPKSEVPDPAFKDGQFRSYRFPPAWAVENQGLEKLRLYETSGSKARKYAADGKCGPDPTVVETTDY